MPFTPIHMGPGIFIKAILQGSFSLMIFGWAQIIMDIQPLIVLLSGNGHLHGFSHTYIGATLLAFFSALSGKPLSELGLKILGISKQKIISISWLVAISSAFIGTYSHVLLDSMMHFDLQPFYPLHTVNDLQGIFSIKALHQFCLYSGILGAIIYYGIVFIIKKE